MVAQLLAATVFLGGLQSQASPRPTQTSDPSCSQTLALGTSPASSELCLGEVQARQATAMPDGSERRRQFEAAAGHYRRAANLAVQADHKAFAFEGLAAIYAPTGLDEYDQYESALREIIGLKPTELAPVFRLAKAQEDRGLIDAAEETLLNVRRQHPDQSDVFKMLAQFYARRTTSLHGDSTVDVRQPKTAPGEPDDQGVYRVGGGMTAPTRLDRPVYPPDAQSAGIEGNVIAEIVIDPAGEVVDAKVVRSIPLLDEAALRAVRTWRFEPTTVNGQPVPVRMYVTVNFTLKK